MRVTSQSWDDPLMILPDSAAANSYSSATKGPQSLTTTNSTAWLWESTQPEIAGPGGRAEAARPWERVSASGKRAPSGSEGERLVSGIRGFSPGTQGQGTYKQYT